MMAVPVRPPDAAPQKMAAMDLIIECDREEDGRWLAEVPGVPGALAYGSTPDEAMARAEAIALHAIAEQLEHGETRPKPITLSVPA